MIIANFHDTPVEKPDRNVRNTAQTGGFWRQSDWHRTCIISIQATNRRNEMPRVQASRRKQAGFTLVEIAIVLVIIGLLLGGVLKGQELINSAKVKNMINDFRATSTFVSGYQDRFRAFPGDQTAAQLAANFGATPVAPFAGGAAIAATEGTGVGATNNGRIDGNWNDPINAPTETVVFWQHVRLANLATGATDLGDPNYFARNADGGRIGIESGINPANGAAAPFIGGMRGSYYVCMAGVLGRYARQIDTTMDDGNTAGGSVQAVVEAGAARGGPGVATAAIVDGTPYIVCAAF
jgi:prepilin-type N-terminal cleavage/methylation domain-containing protein